MLRTTYRRQGAGIATYEYYTKHRGRDGSVDIKGWGVYGPSSVLAGQPMKSFLGSFENDALADAALVEVGIDPHSVNWSSGWVEPQNSYNHLPDEPDW